MITIAEAISDLLFVRDTVVVPGLGAFVKKPVSAKVNPVANYFAMPSSEIAFDSNLREDNDLIVNYMSEKNDIPKEEAQKLLSMFVSDCFNTLKQKKKVVLNQIGTLSYDWVDNIVFEQEKAVNYNADAFGLSDFTPEPVLRSKTKEEIKTEIEQQQKEKNTPMTVDKKAVHQRNRSSQNEDYNPYYDDDYDSRHVPVWSWILLGTLVVAGVVYGLYYLEIITLPWQQKEVPVWAENYTLPGYSKTWEWKEPVAKDSVSVVNDTVKQPKTQLVEQPKAQPVEQRKAQPKEQPVEQRKAQPKEQPKAQPVEQPKEQPKVQPVEQPKAQPKVQPDKQPIAQPKAQPVEQPKPQPVAPSAEANIRIVAGCFGVEENAVKLTNTLKEKGYPNALYEKRSNMWYVSFGRYRTDEEAAAALREIRANTEYKAWILSR